VERNGGMHGERTELKPITEVSAGLRYTAYGHGSGGFSWAIQPIQLADG